MAKQSYYELLKHPKWQAKRLRVLERAGYRCQLCADDETELHVHHTIYRKGAKPWEYEDHELQSLCKDCHAARTRTRADIDALLGRIETESVGSDLYRVVGYLQAMVAEYDVRRESRASWMEFYPCGEPEEIADYFGTTVDEVVAQMPGDEWGADFYDLASLDPRRQKGEGANG